jgi:hypothetical protein
LSVNRPRALVFSLTLLQSLVTEYRKLGVDDFWKKYTIDGKRLTVSGILAEMKAARLQEDRIMTELARKQYGNEFESVFSYQKIGGAGRCTLSQCHAIARRYRKLQGVASTSGPGELTNE